MRRQSCLVLEPSTKHQAPRTKTLRLWAGLLATVWAHSPDCALAEERPSQPASAARSSAGANSGTGLEGDAPPARTGVPRLSGFAGPHSLVWVDFLSTRSLLLCGFYLSYYGHRLLV